jgi:hypothetical protein
MGWVQFSYDVVGTGSDIIAFQSKTLGGYGPALDAVSLVTVPEPSVVALSSIAAVTLLCYRRRKGKVGRTAQRSRWSQREQALLVCHLGFRFFQTKVGRGSAWPFVGRVAIGSLGRSVTCTDIQQHSLGLYR